MKNVKKKLTRREQSRATRLRIIRAAHELFCRHGYGGTRMSDVADEAGVAVQTVYFTFHTKGELLQACYERAVLGEDDPLPPQEQPWYGRMLAARSGRSALHAFAEGNSAIASRVAVLDDVIRSTPHEPDAFAVRARGEQLRRAGYAGVATHIAERFGLRADVGVDRATDLMLTLGSGPVYRMMVLDYGWSHEVFVDWLARALADQLLPSTRAAVRARRRTRSGPRTSAG
ncbi:MAG: TetR/AcrR family transcriptional regulator [Actinobacteria bacterium]|nr:TetR/AcrR family transcriptional regulator [Actinomycetota bacterium]